MAATAAHHGDRRIATVLTFSLLLGMIGASPPIALAEQAPSPDESGRPVFQTTWNTDLLDGTTMLAEDSEAPAMPELSTAPMPPESAAAAPEMASGSDPRDNGVWETSQVEPAEPPGAAAQSEGTTEDEGQLFERIGALTLDFGETHLGSAVVDPTGEFAYFGTGTSPARVVKIDLGTFEHIDTITLETGEDVLRSAVIDPAGSFAYFGTGTGPGRVVKVDLASFERVEAITFNEGENGLSSAVMDPSGGFAYFGTETAPGRVVKVDLASFERVEAITFNEGENGLSSAVIVPTGAFAYFGTWTSPGLVVRVDLDTFSRAGALTLDAGEDWLASAVVDPAGEFAYLGTATSPGRVVKVDLGTPFRRDHAVTLPGGLDNLRSGVMDPSGEFAYFGTWTLGWEGWVVKLDLATFESRSIRLPNHEDNLMAALIDPAGESAYFGTWKDPGRVVKIDLAAFARVDALTLAPSENSVRSAVIDPAGAFAYFGTGTSIYWPKPGRVVKVDLATLTRVDAITIDSNYGLSTAVIDPAGDFAYFGTAETVSRVAKIDLATFTLVDTLTIEDGGHGFSAAVIDPAGEFAYFASEYWSRSLAKIDLETFTLVGTVGLSYPTSAVIDPAGEFAYFGNRNRLVSKVDLETGAVVDSLNLEDDENELRSAVIDPAGEFAYFGTNTDPGRVVRVDLATFTRVGAQTLGAGENGLRSAVIDPAGEFAYFGTWTGPGRVVKVDLASFERVEAITFDAGENGLESAVMDPSGGFAYFGTGTAPGRVVKVRTGTAATPVNRAPVLEPIDDQSVEEGATLQVAVTATDPDGDPITLTVAGLPGFGSFTDHGDGTGTISFAPQPGDAGDYGPFVVTASDGDLQATAEFTLTVIAAATGYTPLAPVRVLDTRNDTQGDISVPVGRRQTVTQTVAGIAGVPADASAVAINITAVDPTQAGFLTVWPSGQPRPQASSINFAAGEIVGNFVLAEVGTGGTVDIYNHNGQVDVVFDLVGYFPAAADYTPQPPVRLLDTRNDTQGDISAPVDRRQTVTQTVAGVAGVPADASAVAINITAVDPTQAGYLSVWPSGQPRPQASSINFAAGEVVGNFVLAEVGTGGTVDIYNHNGEVDVVFDLVGYFPAAADYSPQPPVRVLDTRNDTQGDVSAPVGRRQTVTQTVAGVAGVPADASAVAINITAVNPTQAGYLTVWPSGQPRPQASSINFAAGDIVGNFVIAEVGTGGTVDIYNHNGEVDVVFDLVGYFPAAAD